MLLLGCAGGVGWSSHPRVCFPAPLLGGRPDPCVCDHGAAQGRACQADAAPVAARIGGTVLRWDGPASALARGASPAPQGCLSRPTARGTGTGQPEGCSYGCRRKPCDVKLSAHEGPGGVGGGSSPRAWAITSGRGRDRPATSASCRSSVLSPASTGMSIRARLACSAGG